MTASYEYRQVCTFTQLINGFNACLCYAHVRGWRRGDRLTLRLRCKFISPRGATYALYDQTHRNWSAIIIIITPAFRRLEHLWGGTCPPKQPLPMALAPRPPSESIRTVHNNKSLLSSLSVSAGVYSYILFTVIDDATGRYKIIFEYRSPITRSQTIQSVPDSPVYKRGRIQSRIFFFQTKWHKEARRRRLIKKWSFVCRSPTPRSRTRNTSMPGTTLQHDNKKNMHYYPR